MAVVGVAALEAQEVLAAHGVVLVPLFQVVAVAVEAAVAARLEVLDPPLRFQLQDTHGQA